MEAPRRATAEKSTSKSGSCQVNADIFFDCESVVHYEFARRGHTIKKEYYLEVLKRLRDAVRRKRPRFWSSGDWLLHHDNAPTHPSKLVQQFLAEYKVVQLRQPPYSPDIALCDFWMFPKLNMALKGKRFDDIKTIQRIAPTRRYDRRSDTFRTHLVCPTNSHKAYVIFKSTIISFLTRAKQIKE